MTEQNIRERIWAIADGIPFKLDNITVRTNSSNILLVTAWTESVHFENISRKNVLTELSILKRAYGKLASSFTELKDIVKCNGLTIQYNIDYDDAGKCSIGICSEIGNELIWYI